MPFQLTLCVHYTVGAEGWLRVEGWIQAENKISSFREWWGEKQKAKHKHQFKYKPRTRMYPKHLCVTFCLLKNHNRKAVSVSAETEPRINHRAEKKPPVTTSQETWTQTLLMRRTRFWTRPRVTVQEELERQAQCMTCHSWAGTAALAC